jgi:competence protein ComEA
VTISPSLAAIAGAALVAVVVAFVLRPTQLVPHPLPEPTVERDVERGAPPDRVPALVYVVGAVAHPGVYALPADARARDALAKAGGATHDADLVGVNLAAHVADGDEIAVPREGDPRSAPPSRSSHRPAHRRRGSGGAQRRRRRPQSAAVDVNAADERTLAELPGIGPTLAGRIVEFRAINGPFASVDALGDVAGITPARLDALEPLLTAGR